MSRLFTISLFVIIILLTFGFHQLDRARRAERSLNTEHDVAKYWKDKYNHSNAQVSVLQADHNTFEIIHASVVDSLKKQGIKLKQVKRIETVTLVKRDTVVLVNHQYHDRWRDVYLKDSTLTETSRDSLALITMNSHYGFFNLKTKYVTRAISYNPHTILTGITSAEIVPRERRIHIGIYGGYGLTKVSNTVYAGPQIGAGFTFKIF
jgi:predicted RND superfamily exporter protein